jgi:hypothetical protein
MSNHKTTVRGPQLELLKGPKKILLRLPAGMYEAFQKAKEQEERGLPAYTPRPSVNDSLMRIVGEYIEFWTVTAQTERGAVLAKGLKRKGAARG